jgi:hypothetical protein
MTQAGFGDRRAPAHDSEHAGQPEAEVYMDTANTQTWIVLAGAVVLTVIAFSAWLFYRKKQSHGLKERFGPEYGRAVEQLGSRSKGESELMARTKRVEGLNILPLEPAEATRFSEAWLALQSRFVDNPKGVLMQADQLVRELMGKRGYPVGDFERRAADISVDHPLVVEHYRAAQAIAVRNERGEADTEELRKAVVHYRALFDELLEVRVGPDEGTPRRTPVQS